MNFIHDDVDLSSYMEGPDFRAKVRGASEFRDAVKSRMRPKFDAVRAPSMLLEKGRGIEFRPREVTAWMGYNGHRKSMFTSQMVLDMAVQRQKTLIVSLEMDPAETLLRMVRQASGEKSPSDQTIDAFHDWTDGRIWLFDHVGNLAVDHAFALCRYFAEMGGTQVVLDSMMMICQSEEKLDEQKLFSTGVVRLAQETGLHIHVITHCRKPQSGGEDKVPTRYDIRGSSAISDQAHNVMVVWMNKAKYAKLEAYPHDPAPHEEPCAVIKCDKQRNGKWEGKIKLWMDESSLRFCGDRMSRVMPYEFLSREIQEEAEYV